ncbi:hypothetical protein FACS189479_01880 [Spirochaetia bacterium]|nr:hypothetical protein FACS189479_01880 [Spirochaetia bacterium]
MKHKSILVLIVPIFFALTGTLYAVEDTSASVKTGVTFSIRYFDKQVYHVPGAGGEPIKVQVTIANNSPAVYRFKLADDRAFSIDFDIRTMNNRPVESAGRLVQKRSSSGQVFFREITVESGESFSFVEDLRDYAEFKESGTFIVRAKMYPELLRVGGTSSLGTSSPGTPESSSWELIAATGTNIAAGSGTVSAGTPLGGTGPAPGWPLESNRLSLNLRSPAIPGPGSVNRPVDAETNMVLTREKLAPDAVVEYMLTARQKSQWEKFLLYLDLEAIISRDPVRKRQWNAESEEGRQRMVERYRTELENAVIDGDISAIPSEFTIERTVYNASEGSVIVLEKFRTGSYTERKRYTYTLRRKDDVWTIADYVVVNLGTE